VFQEYKKGWLGSGGGGLGRKGEPRGHSPRRRGDQEIGKEKVEITVTRPKQKAKGKKKAESPVTGKKVSKKAPKKPKNKKAKKKQKNLAKSLPNTRKQKRGWVGQ